MRFLLVGVSSVLHSSATVLSFPNKSEWWSIVWMETQAVCMIRAPLSHTDFPIKPHRSLAKQTHWNMKLVFSLIGHNSHTLSTQLRVEEAGGGARMWSSTPDGQTAAGTQWYFLQRSCSTRRHKMFSEPGKIKSRWCKSLTYVVVFPQVADGHVSSQKHGHAANAPLLHIDVLVVVSVVAWKKKTLCWPASLFLIHSKQWKSI